jgi:hypothetical protein
VTVAACSFPRRQGSDSAIARGAPLSFFTEHVYSKRRSEYNVKDILRWRFLVKRVFGSIEVALEASAAPSLLLHGIAGITLA